MFDRSREGLSNSADAVVRDGRKTLAGQKQDFARAQAEAGNRISSEIEGGLSQINQGVSASTRDMEAATALLTADLRKVLLDLGDRRGRRRRPARRDGDQRRDGPHRRLPARAGDHTRDGVRQRPRPRHRRDPMLRQAQTDAALQMLADLPAFELDLPGRVGAPHRLQLPDRGRPVSARRPLLVLAHGRAARDHHGLHRGGDAGGDRTTGQPGRRWSSRPTASPRRCRSAWWSASARLPTRAAVERGGRGRAGGGLPLPARRRRRADPGPRRRRHREGRRRGRARAGRRGCRRDRAGHRG